MIDGTIFGLIGMLFVQGSYIPQLLKTYTTKDVTSLSKRFIAMIFIGSVSFTIYSITIWDPLYMIANTISVLFSGTLLYLYFKYRSHK